jgi:hypothetical protein
MWDVATGREAARIPDVKAGSLAMLPDGRFVAAGGGHLVAIYRLPLSRSGQLLHRPVEAGE